ncbi:uncharacterized protein LOC136088606 [Hydra vulgaris]|uniref:Uncharacterized protein LOC136088606 n=1 Tax=Hydra vulgaris TaxID=6087 RepID=A0ABM4D3C0_HYDVU
MTSVTVATSNCMDHVDKDNSLVVPNTLIVKSDILGCSKRSNLAYDLCFVPMKILKQGLDNGENVYLTYNGNCIFSGNFEVTTEWSDSVHREIIPKGFGRFFITKVLKNFNKYPKFDFDKTNIDAAILWNLSDREKFRLVELEKSGTEELIPTLCDTNPKKK